MKALSLKTKLLAVSLGAILLLAVVLTMRSYQGIHALSTDITKLSEHNLREALIAKLQSDSLAYGEQVSSYINAAYRISLSMAEIVASNIHSTEPLSRESLGALFGHILKANKDLSSSYAHFEPNGYDGKDADYIGKGYVFSSGPRGNLDIYWVNNPDGSESALKADSEEKYLDKLNEFGQRQSEWYLCPRDKKTPCLMEPYQYEVRPGEYEMMTSLSSPILAKGKFRGVAGVDINLPAFQEMTEVLSQSLYNGQAKVSLITQKGLIVAASHYQNKLARPFSEAHPTLGGELIALSSDQGILITEDTLYVARSIDIKAANTHWSLLIELPLAVALADIQALIDTAAQSQEETISSQILIAILLAALALAAITLIIRSITAPIATLNKQIHQLASADGDLSQRLHLDTHAELISLGHNFNRFLAKLQDMVNSLKDIGQTVRAESNKNLHISEQTEDASAHQQNEVDNVVTATQEMSATAGEVARIAAEVAARTKDINVTIDASQTNLSQAVDTVLELSNSMMTASGAITQVSSRSDEINRILTVIGGIAEQTNLLALNAAIEAARAGEQGRGFAVVADEVRTLAARTQSSTGEINTMISSLQSEVKQAVDIIEEGSQQATSAIEKTRQAHQSLHEVVAGAQEISDNIRQVATAAEEQSSVSEDITKNLTIIGDAAQKLSLLAKEANHSSEQVTEELNRLDQQLSALRT